MSADQTMDAMAERLNGLYTRQLRTAIRLSEFEQSLAALAADLAAISAEMHDEAHELANIATVGQSWRVLSGVDDGISIAPDNTLNIVDR